MENRAKQAAPPESRDRGFLTPAGDAIPLHFNNAASPPLRQAYCIIVMFSHSGWGGYIWNELSEEIVEAGTITFKRHWDRENVQTDNGRNSGRWDYSRWAILVGSGKLG